MSFPPASADDETPPYGQGDTSFRAAGGEAGLRRLVDCFYDEMDSLPQAAGVRRMHKASLDESRDKLARFLCGWLGGPRRYAEKYGSMTIPGSHAPFAIGTEERDAWLECMRRAIAEQPWQASFKTYLLKALSVPAERVRNRP
ncbi:MAG: group II truncated hemoglobin [Pseudomonadales bacterium]